MEENKSCPGAKSATRPGQPHRMCVGCERYEFGAAGQQPRFKPQGDTLVCPQRVGPELRNGVGK